MDNQSIAQQIEQQIEEKHLNQVIDIIGNEIIKNIDKRKDFSNQLIEYRKKNLEDYKDDEDKVIEYFDHENYIREEAYKRFDKRILELNKLKTSPYFGSVEFKEDNYAPENIFIGRFGVTLEGEVEPLIVDWRAPVASLFYKGKTGKASFQAPLEEVNVDILKRKQYLIKKGELEGLFSSDLNVKDEILQAVLCRNTSEKLRDIIMSIQEEQDSIIRLPYNTSALVDGVAGSGKTTIALHRVAYILYNYRKTLQDKVLIFGPNMIFMDYISNVLPELGESGVPQDTFHEFIIKALELKDVESYDKFLNEIFNGNTEFIEDYRYKNSDEFVKKMDIKAEEIENDFYVDKDIIFRGKLVASKQDIDKMFTEYYKKMPVLRKSKKIRRVLFNKISSIRNEFYYEIKKRYENEIKDLSQGERNIRENDIIRKRRMEIHELVKESMDLKATLNYLTGKKTLEYYFELNNKTIIEHQDLAPIMYMELKLNGSDYDKDIKHIIIDEVQDWSMLQLKIIKEFTKCKNFTLVGDKNQSLLPKDDSDNMGAFEDAVGKIKEFKLNKSYRSTKEIMEYANDLVGNSNIVPLVRSGEEIRVNEVVDNDKEELFAHINAFFRVCTEQKFETNAIICDSLDLARDIKELMQDKHSVKLIDSEEVYLTKGNIIIPVCYGKGLEFDGVMMITKEMDKAKSKYVMATRALHKLHHIKIK